jgi:UDP-GlcNAc:undecaprenyl-phosphate GlcNAc-1-phosphate transferase
VDDLWEVKPLPKVAVQLIAAGWICAYPDLRIVLMSNPFGETFGSLGVLSIPLTLFWIVLITNAFNIVDGIDGLASGVAFVATACLFVASVQGNDPYLPLLVAPLGGALIGFLRYNFNPASIFLGDSGSLWIGFLIAVFSIAGYNKSTTAIAVSAPLLFLALPLLEIAVSMVRRFLRGQPIWEADASHIHHQLLKRGFTAKRAVLVLYMGSGLFGLASLFLVGSEPNRIAGGVITVTLVVTASLGLQQLGYTELTEVGHAFRRGFLYQRRIIRNNIIVRKLKEDLNDAASFEDAWPLLVEVADGLYFSRAELVMTPVGSSDLAAGETAEHTNQWCWTAEDRLAGSVEADWSVISVHLGTPGQPATRLELWRSRQEEPLHSELPVLVDVIAERLPVLLSPLDGTKRECVTQAGEIEKDVPAALPSL